MIKKLLFIIVIFLGAITFAQSENSWIKKKDKTEKKEKYMWNYSKFCPTCAGLKFTILTTSSVFQIYYPVTCEI